MSIDDLLSNPNFGKVFKGSRHFKSLFEKALDGVVDPQIAALRKKFQIQINDSGEVIYHAPSLNYTFKRYEGESFFEYHTRLMTGVKKSGIEYDEFLNPIDGMPANLVRSSEIIRGDKMTTDVVSEMFSPTLGEDRRAIEKAAQRSGTTVRYRTFSNEKGAWDRIIDSVGKRGDEALGYIIPESDKIKVIEMFDSSGNKLGLKSIFEAFQIDPNDPVASKRMNALINKHFLSQTFEPGELKVAFFDPKDFFSQDQKNVNRIEQILNNQNLTGEARLAEEKKIYEMMADGQSVMSQSSFDRMVKSLRDEQVQLKNNLKRLEAEKLTGGALGPAKEAEYNKALKNFDELAERLRGYEKAQKSGASFNIRAVGGVDILDPSSGPSFIKGDTVVLPDSEYVRTVRISKIHSALSDSDILSTHLFASVLDKKTELGLDMLFDPIMTLNIQGMPKTAYSNALTIMNFGELVNPGMITGESYIGESLKYSIDEAVESIRSGKISDGLLDIIKKYKNIDPAEYADEFEYLQAMKGQGYARRLSEFIESGGDIRTNDVMSRDLLRIVEQEHFTVKSQSRTINVGGRTVSDYKVRVPMMMSTRAHMLNQDLAAQSASQSIIDNLSMSIKVDYEGGARFGLGALDAALLSPNWGGSDWDDSLSVIYRYDSKAKRLLALTIRDPNAIGEYAILDADITLDKNFAKKFTESGNSVQGLARERKVLLRKITKLTRPNLDLTDSQKLDLTDDFSRLNLINTELDQYFRAEKGIKSIDLYDIFSGNPEDRIYRNAPNASRVSKDGLKLYKEGSVIRGYGAPGFDPDNPARLLHRFTQEVSEELAGNKLASRLPFELVNREYRDYMSSGYFKQFTESPVVTELIEELGDQKGRLTTSIIEARGRAIVESKDVLGKGVNVSTVIEQFTMGHTSTKYGLSEEAVSAIDLILKNNQIIMIDRELFIDAAVKHGSGDLLKLADTAIDDNLETLGRILGEIHNLNLGEDIGLDPVSVAQRLNSDQQRDLVARGYKSVVGGLADVGTEEIFNMTLLDEASPRSYYARVFSEIADAEDILKSQGLEALKGVNQAALEELSALGFEATSSERIKAQKFIDSYYSDVREINKLTSSPDDLLRALQEGLGGESLADAIARGENFAELFGDLTKEEVNINALRRLQAMNLFDDQIALNRQLMAIAQVASESFLADPQAGRSALAPLMDTAVLPDRTSIGQLYGRARAYWKDELIFKQIDQIADTFKGNSGSQVSNILADFLPGGESFDKVADPIERDKRILAAIGKMRDSFGLRNYDLVAHSTLERLGLAGFDGSGLTFDPNVTFPSGSLDDLIDAAHQMPNAQAGSIIDVDTTPGGRRLIDRTIADTAANDQIIRQQKTMSRLNMDYISDLLSKPGFRKGMGAAAIFMGLGLLHQVRGERTPEDMTGPPLLPGGSAYEENYQESNAQLQSIYSSVGTPGFMDTSGYTYKVQAHGNFDPARLSSRLGGITNGRVDSTIYQARQSVNSQPSSSMQLLNSIFE